MTISFTNSVGYTRSFSTNELTIVITNLNATNSYYANGLNDLLYVRVKEGNLLLFDLTNNINRKVFESFTIGYDASNPFNLKFTHNSTAIEYTVDNALMSVGFSGTTPISTLESQYMKLYVITSSTSYLTTNDIVKDVGELSVSPAEIKSFVGANGIVLSNDANNFTISINGSNIADNELTIAKINSLQTSLDNLDVRILTNHDDIAALDLSSISGLSSALNGKMNSGDQIQIWSTGTTYTPITHLKINGSTVTFNSTFAEVTISDLVTLTNTVNDPITGLTGKVSSQQFTSTTNNLDAAIIAVETDILTKQNEITASNRINANLIHDGTVSNLEFSYLNNVTSNLQVQLDAKVDDAKEGSLKFYDAANQQTITSGTSSVEFLNTTIGLTSAGNFTFNVKPLISDIESGDFNSWMINQAKRGHFSLDPPSTVRGYWPCLHGNDYVDVVQERRLLKYKQAGTNGFPVFQNFPRPQPLEYDGFRGDGTICYIVPGISGTSPTQNGLGYPAGSGNPFTVEFQVQKIGTSSTTWGPYMVIEKDIESGSPPSDSVVFLGGYLSNGTFYGYDDRTGNNFFSTPSTAGWGAGNWTHYALVGTGTQYKYFVNGVLRATLSPGAGYLTVLDKIEFQNGVSTQYSGIIREICVWTGEIYTSDFDSQYSQHLRWNGMMLN